MKYTLRVCGINHIPNKEDAARIDGKSIEVESDGMNLIIDGVPIPVKFDPSFMFHLSGGCVYSHNSADRWIEELERDMRDPNRFWSETYFSMLVNAIDKVTRK